jgi:hypothetical protein
MVATKRHAFKPPLHSYVNILNAHYRVSINKNFSEVSKFLHL